MQKAAKKQALAPTEYPAFDQLDGNHPWKSSVPEGLISYPVRRLNMGRVCYFNFDLAKEMGLIPSDHPHRMNKKLENRLLETFSLRIINEYDQQHGVQFPRQLIKKNEYMATRYLQLQHHDKTGRTSGDGRCIWNGTYSNGKKTWDISSRGTGVTALAPGAVLAGKPLKSGNTTYGYGCGLADIDELIGASLMAEIIHRNGHSTERVLCVIDLGKGSGIGVRAAPNLIRPAHFFLYLKQNRLEPLKRAVDYFIDRQIKNGELKASARADYDSLLDWFNERFAKFVAYLDRDYIFAWLDWDGDNVLANAGIIDYGSVRQFGLRHDNYRYDDVDRFSTNLNEQKMKAREMIQVFVQMIDFLKSGSKKPIGHFKSHPCLQEFDRRFQHHLLDRFLYQLGFDETMRRLLMNRHPKAVRELFQIHSDFERIKTHKKPLKVADGIHRPAIFNMRSIMAQMPARLVTTQLQPIDTKDFFQLVLSSQAGRKDRKLTRSHIQKIAKWQSKYIKLIRRVSSPLNVDKLLKSMSERAVKINREDRMTGNALINIVDELLKFRKKGAPTEQIQAAIDEFITLQTLNPDHRERVFSLKGKAAPPSILHALLTVTYGYREDI